MTKITTNPHEGAPNTLNSLRRVGEIGAAVGLMALTLATLSPPAEASSSASSASSATKLERIKSDLSANTDKGYLEIGGKRTFPRFSWNADSSVVPQLLDLGINVFAGVSDPDKKKFTSLLGNNGYYMGQYGEDMSGLPNAIGSMADEPDGYHEPPDKFNPPPAGLVGAMNYTQHFRGDVKGWDMSVYPQYRTKASMFGFDDYLANRYDVFSSGKENQYNYIGLFYDIQKDLVEYADGGVTWGWVETGVIDSQSVNTVMKPEWVNIEAGLMMAGGAKGIGWWTNTWPNGQVNKFDVTQENQAVIKALDGQFDRYTELFTSDIIQVPDIKSDNPVKAGVRKKGNNFYAIIANASGDTQHIQQYLPGLMGQPTKLIMDNSLGGLLKGEVGQDAIDKASLITSKTVLKGNLEPYQWIVVEYSPITKIQAKTSSPAIVSIGGKKVAIDQSAAKSALQTIKRTEAAQKPLVKKHRPLK